MRQAHLRAAHVEGLEIGRLEQRQLAADVVGAEVDLLELQPLAEQGRHGAVEPIRVEPQFSELLEAGEAAGQSTGEVVLVELEDL